MQLDARMDDLTLWIGLVITLIGAVATSPSAVRLVLRGAAERLKKWRLWMLRTAARLFSRLRRPQVSSPYGIAPTSEVGTPRVRYGDNAPIESQLKQIWGELDNLLEHVHALEAGTGDRLGELRSELEQTRAKSDRRDANNTQVSSYAIFPIVVGIFLTSIPELIASLPVAWWTLAMAGSLLFAFVMAVRAFKVS